MGIWEIIKGEQPGLITTLLNYQNAGQFGEFATEFALKNDNLEGELVVLKNVYVPTKERTTEIDLLMIHEKGIFVFESKNYSGWIFGSSDQLNWTQVLKGGQKNKFYNPIRQNRTHIRALAEYLGKPAAEFTSYIVFSERCTLKSVPGNTPDVTIVRRPDMLSRLRAELRNRPQRYTVNEMAAMYTRLFELTYKTEEEKRQHVEDIKTKCPFCGADLVLRNGKYGKFWGCSAYPKCKFTRKEDA